MSEPGPARLDAAEILRRLVAFDTVSARSNLDLIRWVADYLDGYGVAATLTYDEHRQKANLFATIGPADRGGVILSGHTDVVPVEGQAWDSDPFALAERDGRLYGRGTADMKGFIATALAAVPGFRAASLKTPIHLAFSYDEEVGCFGVPRLIEALPEGEARPKLVIIGEPTSMRVVSQHKGCTVFATTVTGAEQHSSATHRGVNAIAAAAEIVAEIERMAAEKRTAARPDSGFVPPYTTLSVGTIGGGTAQNIIPRHGRLTWEYRIAHVGDELAGAEAADLLVVAEREVHRERRVAGQKGGGLRQRDGNEALHVGRAAAVEPPVLHLRAQRVRRPVLPVPGHRVGVAGDDDAGRLAFAQGGEQVGLLPVRVEGQP